MLCLHNRFVVFRAILGFCMEGYRSFIGHDVAKLSCIATFLHSLFRITEKLLFSALCSDQSERQDADMPFPRGEGVSGVVYEQMSAFSHSQPSPQPLSQKDKHCSRSERGARSPNCQQSLRDVLRAADRQPFERGFGVGEGKRLWCAAARFDGDDVGVVSGGADGVALPRGEGDDAVGG